MTVPSPASSFQTLRVIYPPKAARDAALASADPEHVTDVSGFF